MLRKPPAGCKHSKNGQDYQDVFRPFEAFEEIDRAVAIEEVCCCAGYLRLPRCVIERDGERTQTAAAIHLLTPSTRVETKLSLPKIASTACLSGATVKRHLKSFHPENRDPPFAIESKFIGGCRVARKMGAELRKIFRGQSRGQHDNRFCILPRWAASIFVGNSGWSRRICLALLLNKAFTIAGLAGQDRRDCGDGCIEYSVRLLAKHAFLDVRTVRKALRDLDHKGLIYFDGDDSAELNPNATVPNTTIDGLRTVPSAQLCNRTTQGAHDTVPQCKVEPSARKVELHQCKVEPVTRKVELLGSNSGMNLGMNQESNVTAADAGCDAYPLSTSGRLSEEEKAELEAEWMDAIAREAEAEARQQEG